MTEGVVSIALPYMVCVCNPSHIQITVLQLNTQITGETPSCITL